MNVSGTPESQLKTTLSGQGPAEQDAHAPSKPIPAWRVRYRVTRPTACSSSTSFDTAGNTDVVALDADRSR